MLLLHDKSSHQIPYGINLIPWDPRPPILLTLPGGAAPAPDPPLSRPEGLRDRIIHRDSPHVINAPGQYSILSENDSNGRNMSFTDN